MCIGGHTPLMQCVPPPPNKKEGYMEGNKRAKISKEREREREKNFQEFPMMNLHLESCVTFILVFSQNVLIAIVFPSK